MRVIHRGSADPALCMIFDLFVQDTELSRVATKGDCEELKITPDQAIQACVKLVVLEERQGLPAHGLLPPRNEIPEPFGDSPEYQVSAQRQVRKANSLPCICEDDDGCGGAPGWGGLSRHGSMGKMTLKSRMIQRKPVGELVTYHSQHT